MGVRYVLEGSVRKAGNRVRVTAQLIEAETSNHIWVERYDRDLTDVLTLRANLPSSSSLECPLLGVKRTFRHDRLDVCL